MVDDTFDNLTVNNVASINGNFYGWALFLNNGGININNDSYLKGDVRINNSPAANSDSHLYLKSKDASTTWSTHLYNYRDGNFVIDVSKNCIVDLSDAAGSSKFIIRDSAFAEVASINSDGQLKVMENFYAGGNYKVSINTSGELWFGNGSTWKNKIYYPNGTVDTLATNGNFAVEKQLKLSCACPYFSTWYGAQGLEQYFWELEWDGNQWNWTAHENFFQPGDSFIRFTDTAYPDNTVDICIIRGSQEPTDPMLWISRSLSVKKDFSCGGAATVHQGALILGSDWDAHSLEGQMPQIYLAHSEGSPYYPNNPKRDTLQIWRAEHVGFANLNCGSIVINVDNPTLDLKTNDNLKVTLKFDGENGMLYTSTGDLVLAGNSTHVRPLSNNTYLLGDSSFKWKEIWAVTTHFGDAVFANGWRLTEDEKDGVLLVRPDGSIAQKWR